jgi:hypothetical protein
MGVWTSSLFFIVILYKQTIFLDRQKESANIDGLTSLKYNDKMEKWVVTKL